jgi:2-acylglycerol O-acyltransferase 2
MKEGRTIVLMPGGFEEAALTSRGADEAIYINKRRGFIKYAMKYGYKIYPVYVFGENNLYHTIEAFQSIRLKIASLNIPGVLFWGQRFAPWLPLRESLKIVVGQGISPQADELEASHKQYIQAISRLYQVHTLTGGSLKIV